MNKKSILLWAVLAFSSMTAFAQVPLEELEGAYAPADLRSVERTIMKLQRSRADTIRIIICDTSLFRNDLIKGPLNLYQHDGELYCAAEGFRARMEYNRETGELTMIMINERGKEKVIGRWRRVKERP